MISFAIILAVFFLIGCDGEIDAVSFDLQKPDYEYEVDTWGSNSKVYEITPKSNANMSCLVFIVDVFILDNVNDVAMQCFDKKLPNND